MADIESNIRDAKTAAMVLATKGTEIKDLALEKMASILDSNRAKIIFENAKDVEAAKNEVSKGNLPESMVKRLTIDDQKIDGMIAGIRDVKGLKDPVGETLSTLKLDDGLTLYQVCCPIGLIGVIFESRPDVVPQIMSLCVKSGNGVAFKGGSEASASNKILFELLTEAISSVGIDINAFVLMETRDDIAKILRFNNYIDLLIPRGSNSFVKYIQTNTSIPVLGHAAGICHIFVDSDADLELAKSVTLDSKIQYPAVCNAVETLLVDSKIAAEFLPDMNKMFVDSGVEVRADSEAKQYMAGAIDATDEDWDSEYNELIISVKIVDGLETAIDHINLHGSHHTDCIITDNRDKKIKFTTAVDSADVFVNASTRFADGFRFGKGAEVGISTNKIHSRGPVGMEGLMIYKYILIGEGHVVKDYAGKDAKAFKHERIDESVRF